MPEAFTGSAANSHDVRRVIAEMAKRKSEALRLYVPMPVQDAFHRSKAKERILVAGNRAGKTLTSSVEVARAVCWSDPYDKYPKTPATWYLVGKSSREVGEVMYKYLFKPGRFFIIRDSRTGEWRAYDPVLDKRRSHEKKPAPALIPKRMYDEKGIAWENKKENLPRLIRLTNGCELHFFTANGLPPQGTAIDGAWFTEEIPQSYWYPEIAARLIDKNGVFIWDGTPQVGTEHFHRLHERAEEQVEKGVIPRTVEEFRLSTKGNVHTDADAVTLFEDKLDEDELDIRVHGEFAFLEHKVYPEYRPIFHEEPWREIPPHWTRYVAIDPGMTVTAAVFGAVSQPDEGKPSELWLYKEIHLKGGCTATQFAEEMSVKCYGEDFEAFIIDWSHARKRETSGRTIEEQYAEALERRRIRCRQTGSWFVHGNTDLRGGVENVKNLLLAKPGHFRLRFLRDGVPQLIWEIKHYKKRRVGGVITDEPEERGRHDCLDCLRYLVQYRPEWIAGRKRENKGGPAHQALMKKRKDHARMGAGDILILGPLGGMI